MAFLDTLLQTLTAGASGGFKSRPSNKDYQFEQDLLDSSNPREATRQNQFLEMTTPVEAQQYNTYQDQTQPQDTQRQINRIQTESSQLGMSPWEIAGNGGQNPMPAPDYGPQQGATGGGAGFLSAATPIAIAKMQTEASLKQALIQADTQRYVADQNTVGGKLPQSQYGINIAQRENTVAQLGAIKTGQQAAANAMIVSTLNSIINALPKTTISAGPLSTTSTDGASTILKFFGKYANQDMTSADGKTNPLGDALASLKPDDWTSVKNAMKQLLSNASQATGLSGFLAGLTGNKK